MSSPSSSDCRAVARARMSAPGLQASRSGFLAGLQRIADFAPGFHAAVERDGALKSHGAQSGCRERRDVAQLAARDDAARGVRQILVDTQVELAARQPPCA